MQPNNPVDDKLLIMNYFLEVHSSSTVDCTPAIWLPNGGCAWKMVWDRALPLAINNPGDERFIGAIHLTTRHARERAKRQHNFRQRSFIWR
jgi:hypothetical protein